MAEATSGWQQGLTTNATGDRQASAQACGEADEREFPAKDTSGGEGERAFAGAGGVDDMEVPPEDCRQEA